MRWARGTRRIVFPAALAAALALSACGPAGAVAQTRHPFVPPGFKVHASHGYTVSVFGFDSGKGPITGEEDDQVFMVASKPGAEVVYGTDLRSATGHRFTATFPGIAEVSVAFRPLGGTVTRKRACSDERIVYQRGFYEGTFTFAGEEGYAAAAATQAPADLGFFNNLDCTTGIGMIGGPGVPGASLEAGTIGELETENAFQDPKPIGPPQVGLRALKNTPGAATEIGASIEEDQGTMIVIRAIERRMPASAFQYTRGLTSARLAPGPPFSGTAALRPGAPAARRWSGDLTVDLPGEAAVPLTGSRVRASIRHAHITHEAPHPSD